MELKLHTSYDNRFISQAWEEHGSDIMEGRRATIMQRIVDTEEAGIRQALINMGWTPPDPSGAVLKLSRKDDGRLWLQAECSGKHFALNLDSVHTARWFVDACLASMDATCQDQTTTGADSKESALGTETEEHF